MLATLSRNNPNAGMLHQAACGIVVCGDKNAEGLKEFLYADCAAAVQNMLLCIHGLGLGGVWCGVRNNSEWHKRLVELLTLPLKVEPIAVIALGHPGESKAPVQTWDAGKIHDDTW